MALAFAHRPAGAAPWALSALRWSAPEDCPSAADVEARLVALVGSDLATTGDADVDVTREAEGRYVARLRVGRSPNGNGRNTDVGRSPNGNGRSTDVGRSPNGNGRNTDVGLRVLEEAACDVLADAVVTVVAMSLAAPGPTNDAEPAAPPSAASTPVSTDASVPSRAASADSEPRLAFGVVAMADYGTLPSTALGGGVALAWYPVLPLRLEATLLRSFEQSAAVAGAPFGGSFQLTSADLRACWSLLGRVVTVGPCAGVEIAHIDASGYGSTTVSNGAETWWSPSVGGAVRWQPIRHLAFSALTDIVFPATRRPFVILNAGTIYQPALASPRSLLFAEVRF
jgi:hypothetical protein